MCKVTAIRWKSSEIWNLKTPPVRGWACITVLLELVGRLQKWISSWCSKRLSLLQTKIRRFMIMDHSSSYHREVLKRNQREGIKNSNYVEVDQVLRDFETCGHQVVRRRDEDVCCIKPFSSRARPLMIDHTACCGDHPVVGADGSSQIFRYPIFFWSNRTSTELVFSLSMLFLSFQISSKGVYWIYRQQKPSQKHS